MAIRAKTVASASKGWVPGTKIATLARSHPGKGRRANSGINPARAKEDLPEPEGP